MNNYEFCADFAARHGGRVLDYGCGQGQIVELLLDKGRDAYGCDVFYEGGDYSAYVPERLVGHRVKRMDGDRIPFPDGHFDVVVHNQVFEHVPNIDIALAEIARVLKPGGVMLALFPDAAVWREGHCGVPFLHWFRKGSFRVYYALSFRVLGLGKHHGDKSSIEWSRNFCDWLDRWTYYRPYGDIRRSLLKHFSEPRHIEAEWFDKRKPAARLIPPALKTFAARRLAGMVFWCEKVDAYPLQSKSH